jgi:hypothetical protein
MWVSAAEPTLRRYPTDEIEALPVRSRGVADAPSSRTLLDRAEALARRADALSARAQHPFTRDQIVLIALAARDAIHWIVESGSAEDRLSVIAETLRSVGQRLDELGELLDTHGVDAVPPGHA